jgi:hypothetical protein
MRRSSRVRRERNAASMHFRLRLRSRPELLGRGAPDHTTVFTVSLCDSLFEALRGSSGAGLAVDGAVGVGKRNCGVSGPLVGTIVELNGLRDGLRACRETRSWRRRRGGEIDKSHALDCERVVTLVLPNTMASAPLTHAFTSTESLSQ